MLPLEGMVVVLVVDMEVILVEALVVDLLEDTVEVQAEDMGPVELAMS